MVLISMLLTAGIAFWFYRTAERLGSKAMHWGVAGAIAYQVPAWAWMMLVSRPYMAGIRGVAAKTTLSASLMSHSWVVVGILCAWVVYRFFLLKTTVKDGAAE
ncbi:hypothetical protein [Methylomagnum ishizawai]|uniref:hypothetical protein n=1 Tax=Methylomagnum ishizawai TaxID=1760988 RepID=UPI001C338E50|nr:hypothetical protein [Methylomagnum ishizawai]BBL76242.1 hypothetical protein MishRS11D_33400 [Methylomagnum ishizawai]